MNILGINVGHDAEGGPARDGGACLLVDGEVRGAIAEERLTREKHCGGYQRASALVLRQSGISLKAVDLVAVSSYGDEPRLERFGDLGLDGARRVEMVPSHHLSHACSAFFPAKMDDALVLVADNEGNILGPRRHDALWRNSLERLTMYRGRGCEIELLERDMDEEDVVSLGELYGNMTRFVGFGSYLNAGRTMALASFGDPGTFGDVPLVRRLPAGKLQCPVDNDYDASSEAIRRHFRQHGHTLPPQRDPEKAPISKLWADLAATVQAQLEAGLVHKVQHWVQATGVRKLCLAGGVALNCVANRRLLDDVPLEQIYVQPNAIDQGQSLGNVLYAWHRLLGRTEPVQIQGSGVYLGGTYDRAACSRALGHRAHTVYEDFAQLAAEVASALANGAVVGWFQGRSEWGPRALGNRSILADPRDAAMRERVNAKVKHREAFRPFAPVVPLEDAAAFFDITCPTMTVVGQVRPDAAERIPAVVHVDGSARLQTVARGDNPRLHALLRSFETLSGVPVLLNTSFNDRGQPIVETPEDAVQCFEATEIDLLVLGDLLVHS